MAEILTVSELTSSIKQLLEMRYSSLSVRGEISNLKLQTSGHSYFTLKDAGAQLSAVLFKGNALALQDPLREGEQVVLYGELSLYPPRGNYQLIVRKVEREGTGLLLKQLHELKLRLQALGWFDPKIKKKLPRLPRRIGIVTSPTGAVIQDILNILSRRFPSFQLILNPVRVQGKEAGAEIAQAIEQFNTHDLADVLIVARGGGSLEDLWPFNEEIVARAIFASRIPIISAVGHETDFSISDFVADVRAPTPSAAAELVIEEKEGMLKLLARSKERLGQALTHILRGYRQRLQDLQRHPRLLSPLLTLGFFAQRLDGCREELDLTIKEKLKELRWTIELTSRKREGFNPVMRLERIRNRLEGFTRLFETKIVNLLRYHRGELSHLKAHLEAINPKNLLKRGYAILFREKNSSLILSTKTVSLNERLTVQLHDGLLHVSVDGKRENAE